MSNRRGKGEGSIYPVRRNGRVVRWASSIELGHTAGHRQRRVVYGTTRKEVSEKLKGLHHQQHAGTLRAVDKATVGGYLIGWLDGNTKRRPTTMEVYRRIVNVHVIPRIGDIRLDKLTSDDVNRMITAIVKAGMPTTARQARQILNRAFKDALASQPPKMAYNPVTGTEIPSVEVKPARDLSEAESQRLVAACDGERFGIAVLLGLWLGMRQGEVKGLQWSDIDWNEKTIAIRRTGRRTQGKRGTGPTKTPSSARLVPLVADLEKALRLHQTAQAEEFALKGYTNTMNLIVASQAATMYDTPNYLVAFRKLLKKADLPVTMRPHDLRHSTATILIMRGVDPKTVADILGHASARLTLDIYARAASPQRRKAAQTMAKVTKPK